MATKDTPFVRYSPDVDTIGVDFDAHLATVLEGVERYVAGSVTTEKVGRAVRFAHAKGYGLVKGEFEILSELPAEYAQGIYATPGTHDALVRFSNGSAHLGADAVLPGATGLAVKIFDIAGPTLLEDEPHSRTFDYNTINAPVFFCNTAAHYLFIAELFTEAQSYFAQGKAGAHRFFSDYLTGKGTLPQDEWAWDELLAFLTIAKLPSINLLLATHWTMGAVRHGDYMAKVRFAPSPASAAAVVHRVVDKSVSADAYTVALTEELKARPYEFDVQVQLCTDLGRMPVHDLTVEWPETLSPFVTVARLRFPQQDINRPETIEAMDALSFTPWRVTAAHAPIGDIQRVRKEVYRRSSLVRHRLNHQARQEPSRIADVLP